MRCYVILFLLGMIFGSAFAIRAHTVDRAMRNYTPSKVAQVHVAD